MLVRDIGRDQVAKLETNLHTMPGVTIDAAPQRAYPNGNLAAHILGYMNEVSAGDLKADKVGFYGVGDLIGRFGIERAYEDDLHGRVGYQQVETNAQGRVLRVLQKTSPVLDMLRNPVPVDVNLMS